MPVTRDSGLIVIEKQVRQAIRDAVNQTSRKPFHWGGLCGYQQLEAIAQALKALPESVDETGYFQRIQSQVNRALQKNRRCAQTWPKPINGCSGLPGVYVTPPEHPLTTQVQRTQVARDIEALLYAFTPSAKVQFPQAHLRSALKKRWQLHQQELLACYEVAGLPQDNLQMESLFEQLRRRQRRISGRKSTRELRNFGQAQVLFHAESEEVLLDHIRYVHLADYRTSLAKLTQAEQPQRFIQRLHHDPAQTMTQLVKQYTARYTELSISKAVCQSRVLMLIHTE